MISELDALLNDPRQGFLAHARTLLSARLFAKQDSQLRKRIARVWCCDPGAEKEDILSTAESELTGQLLEHRDDVELYLSHLEQMVQLGELSPEEVWTEVFNKGFSYLNTALSDAARAQDPNKNVYKRLRECLSKSGQFAWSRDGTSYGPPDLPPESPAAPPDEAGFADLPEPESVALEKVITRKYLAPQALRFWHSYIERRLNGVPHFLPVHTLQKWLCRKYTLAPFSQQEGLYIENEDGSYDLRSHPQLTTTRAPDVQFEEAEMLERAKNFVLGLPDRQVKFCAHYYGNEERQEDVAHVLGYSKPSGLNKVKKNFENRLGDTMAEYADLLGSSPAENLLAQSFLDAVYNACEKASSGVEKETGGCDDE